MFMGLQNGEILYKFLAQNLVPGNRIAAHAGKFGTGSVTEPA
jgi:hypothetical protein